MLPPSLHSAITRACSSTFSGVELLSPPRNWPLSAGRAHIAILDSSFNPPTRAHLAIAASAFPPPHSAHPHIHDPGPYTARLLLYSPKNADKTPKAGDANPAQRAAMMLAQARALDAVTRVNESVEGDAVAVGLVQAPTFVAKAEALIAQLGALDANPDPPALTFLVGTDTLVRVFEPRYYSDMGAALEALFACAWLVSVRRGDETARAEEDALLSRPAVAPWVAAGKVRLVDALEDVGDVSSTAVRDAVRRGAADELEGLVVPEVAEMLLREGLYLL